MADFDYDLVVLNGIVVTDTETGAFDIAVKDEKIHQVVARGGLSEATARRTIDAQGGYVMARHADVRQEKHWAD